MAGADIKRRVACVIFSREQWSDEAARTYCCWAGFRSLDPVRYGDYVAYRQWPYQQGVVYREFYPDGCPGVVLVIPESDAPRIQGALAPREDVRPT